MLTDYNIKYFDLSVVNHYRFARMHGFKGGSGGNDPCLYSDLMIEQ